MITLEVIYTIVSDYKPEAKPSVYRSDINLLRGLYII